MQLTYLCGSHFQCANNTNKKALQVKHDNHDFFLSYYSFQMAKYNLETRYSVVGLVEHFNTSLAIMEKYLPGKRTQKMQIVIQWICSILFRGIRKV